MATCAEAAQRNPDRIAAPGEYSRGCSRRAETAGRRSTRSCRSGSKPFARSCGICDGRAIDGGPRQTTLKRQLDELHAEMQRRAEQSPRAEPAVTTTPDPAFELIPAGHQFCSVQIVLMLGWVLRGITLRGACSALAEMQEMDVDWGFNFPVPHFTTVRFWLLRLGHYNLHRPKEQGNDWVWIIDHSNQIGQEKCLLILGVRASQLPPPGEDFPLRLAQMEPIELEPVTVSDKEVVYRQLEANTAKTGVPRAIISDHGGDLAGGIELFRKQHPETLDIYDITHKAACLLKAQLERDEQWNAFASLASQTKCKIQQTEWAFLVPPSQRSKARYMNLGELVRWGSRPWRSSTALDPTCCSTARWNGWKRSWVGSANSGRG